jgi:hypothetical protein
MTGMLMTLLAVYSITIATIWLFPGVAISPTFDAGGAPASCVEEACPMAPQDPPVRPYPGLPLARHHEARLAQARILPEVALARGVRTITEAAKLVPFHFAAYQRRVPGLLLPVYPVVGPLDSTSGRASEFAAYRPDEPRRRKDHVLKYEAPLGARNCLDCLPVRRALLADPRVPLVITEGLIKSDAITSAAIREGASVVCVSVQGTWNWRGRNVFDGLTAVADWEQIALNDRPVFIAFDSDAARNPSVHIAMARLKVFLEARGATVLIVYLPDRGDGSKCGADDYLADHTLLEMLALADLELRPLPDGPAVSPSSGTADHVGSYAVPPEEPAVSPDPCPMPALSELLAEVHTFLCRFVVFASPHQPVAVTLWAVHTHAFEAADTTPYVWVSSPKMRSGKSRTVDALALLVARPWRIIEPSEAVMFRKIHAERPTTFLDEIDTVFHDKQMRQMLRGILDEGHYRGATVPRCVGDGAALSYKDFSIFCPKLIGGIGTLPGTIADRSIPIRLKRRKRDEPVERFRRRDVTKDASPIVTGLARWAKDSETLQALGEARPRLPAKLNDRAADVWEPLFAIADLAGGEWPKRARDAAMALHGDPLVDTHEDDADVRLFGDLREIFGEEVFLATAIIVEELAAIPEAPWAEWRKGGKPLNAHGLAKLLKPFGITPKPDLKGQVRGYYRADFKDSWARYLEPEADEGGAEDSSGTAPTDEAAPTDDAPAEPQAGTGSAEPEVEKTPITQDPWTTQEPFDTPPELRRTAFSDFKPSRPSETVSNKGQRSIFRPSSEQVSDGLNSPASPSKIWVSDGLDDCIPEKGENADSGRLPTAPAGAEDASSTGPPSGQLPLHTDAQAEEDSHDSPGPGWWLALRSSDPDDAP